MQSYIKSCHVLDVLDMCITKPDTSWWWISKCPEITWDIINANPSMPWNWHGVSCNQNITIDVIKNNPTRPWCWGAISENKSITWDVICSNPDLPWNWHGVSCNPNITIEIIKANPDRNWDWADVSVHPNTTIQVLLENVGLPWNWYRATIYNPNITWKHIRRHRNLHLHALLWNPNIDWEEIKRRPHLTIPSISTSDSKHITWDMIADREERSWTWNWDYISSNPCVTFDIIMSNPDRAWNWTFIGRNPNISLKHVEDHPDKGWNWCSITCNPNIFKCSPTRRVVNEIKRWHAACVIQRCWFYCVTDPTFMMCRKRLLRELTEMASRIH